MTFIDSIKTCFRKIVTWKGRASRSEFWWFHLFSPIAIYGTCFIISFIGGFFEISENSIIGNIAVIAICLMVFVFYVAHISAMIRRLHDVNNSGWWFWIFLVPLIGGFWLLIFFCEKGTRGANKYGSDPLGEDLAKTFG